MPRSQGSTLRWSTTGAALDSFVASLIEAGAAEIARQAESLPTPPSLDAVRANARSAAVAAFEDADGGDLRTAATTTAGVGVMDPDAPGRPSEPPLPVDPLRPGGRCGSDTEPVSHGNGTVRILRILRPEGLSPACVWQPTLRFSLRRQARR